jgi:Right handed beta helix region/Fibronectin type III domain
MQFKLFIWLIPIIGLLTACPDPPPPATLNPPTGLAATPGDGQVILAWQTSSVKDLASYIIKFETAGNVAVETTVIAPATATTIKQLSNDKDYNFSIAVEIKDKSRSAFSAVVKATPKAVNTGGGNNQPKVSTPTGLVAAAGDASVMLSWNANPETDLKSYTLFWGTSSATLDKSKSVVTSTKNLLVDALSNGTTYFFALEAENTKGEKSARSNLEVATPTATPVQPVIESITIEDNGNSLQVRQGGSFAMIVKGQRLGTVSAILGTLNATVSSNTDTAARLEFTIPHGHSLDFLALSLTTAGGTLVKSNAVKVSPIAASKVDTFFPDDNNSGTQERPFLTLTQALTVAAFGDTILLGPGDYEVGEAWPTNTAGFPPTITPNVPNGVTIVGQSRNAVVLQGPGIETTTSALVFTGSATVSNLTVRDFNRALVHTYYDQGYDGDITLETLEASENHDGFLDIGAGSITIKNSIFDDNRPGSGIALFNTLGATVENTTFTGNTYGIYVRSIRGLSLSSVMVKDSLLNGIDLEDIEVAELTDVHSLNNNGDGIQVKNEDVYSFRLRDSELSDNQQYGIEIFGNEFASWDLGTVQDPGNNTLSDNNDWQLYDNRVANTGVTITVQGNTIGSAGDVANAGTFTSGAGGSELVKNTIKIWRIQNEGNSIAF